MLLSVRRTVLFLLVSDWKTWNSRTVLANIWWKKSAIFVFYQFFLLRTALSVDTFVKYKNLQRNNWIITFYSRLQTCEFDDAKRNLFLNSKKRLCAVPFYKSPFPSQYLVTYNINTHSISTTGNGFKIDLFGISPYAWNFFLRDIWTVMFYRPDANVFFQNTVSGTEVCTHDTSRKRDKTSIKRCLTRNCENLNFVFN